MADIIEKKALDDEKLENVSGGIHISADEIAPLEKPETYFVFRCTGCGKETYLKASESAREHPCLCGKPGAYLAFQGEFKPGR